MENSIHHEISLSSKLFDIPTQSFLLGHVANSTMGSPELWLFSIIRHRDKYLK